MTVTVRLARDDDHGRLLPLVEAWIPEINPDGYALEPRAEVLRDSLWARKTTAGNALVIMDDGERLVGVLALVFHGWGADPVGRWASECLWYVLPAFSGYARQMVAFARGLARAQGCRHMTFSTNRLSSERADSGPKFLAAMGFRPLYTIHVCDIEQEVAHV